MIGGQQFTTVYCRFKLVLYCLLETFLPKCRIYAIHLFFRQLMWNCLKRVEKNKNFRKKIFAQESPINIFPRKIIQKFSIFFF